MIINTNSWHYKLLMFMGKNGWDVPQSLCPYVRSVVWEIIKLISYLIVSVCVVVVWFMPEVDGGSAWYEVVSYIIGTFFNIVIGMGLSLLVLVGVAEGTKWVYENKIKTQFNSNNTAKEPNIFVEYYKAWHDKICPTIEFKNKENK